MCTYIYIIFLISVHIVCIGGGGGGRRRGGGGGEGQRICTTFENVGACLQLRKETVEKVTKDFFSDARGWANLQDKESITYRQLSGVGDYLKKRLSTIHQRIKSHKIKKSKTKIVPSHGRRVAAHHELVEELVDTFPITPTSVSPPVFSFFFIFLSPVFSLFCIAYPNHILIIRN